MQWRRLIVLGEILAVAVVVGGIGLATKSVTEAMRERRTPPGWSIIRPPRDVCTLAVDGNQIWAGGKDGITLIDRRTRRVLTAPRDAASLRYVMALLRTRDDLMWIAHAAGITRARSDSWIQHDTAGGAPLRGCRCLLEDAAGTLWSGTEDGLFRFDGAGWQSVRVPPLADGLSIDTMLEDRDRTLWIGSASPVNGGLFRFATGTWHAFPDRAQLPHPAVNAIAQDLDGTIWIGTGYLNQGAAAWYDGCVWRALRAADGLAGQKVRSIYIDPQRRILFGFEYDGMTVCENGAFRHYDAGDGLAGKEVRAVVQDQDGVYWLATNNGINRIEKL
ncbi:MAG: two-component regulator propeller domain-containing protein [Acidobacteriota bacterium]